MHSSFVCSRASVDESKLAQCRVKMMGKYVSQRRPVRRTEEEPIGSLADELFQHPRNTEVKIDLPIGSVRFDVGNDATAVGLLLDL
jgi:hypothetical protein